MDKFQDAYQNAVRELPKFHMEAGQVSDEIHHYRMVKQGRKYLITRGCTVAAVFLLCGVGTVAGKNIRDAYVRVSDNGFVITSETAKADSREGIPDTASILKEGGVFSIEDGIPEEEIEVEEYEMETEEYDSLEEFWTRSDAAADVPDVTLLGKEFTSERVYVIDGGRDIFITLSNDDVCFSLTQADNRGYESYSSATSFMGESQNERNFVNSEGFSYLVMDSVDEEGAVLSVNAAISVNGRDLTLSFQGFDLAVIEETLYHLDLSVYFQE